MKEDKDKHKATKHETLENYQNQIILMIAFRSSVDFTSHTKAYIIFNNLTYKLNYGPKGGRKDTENSLNIFI